MNTIQLISVSIIPLVFAITVHEAAHGWVANKLGDATARQLGRLTFNPIPHIDPVGTILVPLAMLVLGGFIFGWAKPVPVNMRNFRHPRQDMALVAVAGPAANLLMALLWGLVWKLTVLFSAELHGFAMPLLLTARIGIFLNVLLMVLNLLPLPPLDGSRVLTWLLPPRLAARVDQIEPYGVMILVALLFLGLWDKVIRPITALFNALIEQILGIQL
ncbi:MAG TPA: site-2 protease family protein [Gammaproteobacteria bacterium]|nr:site-2 protease family protein [Gammaproteobacteria bacterium]